MNLHAIVITRRADATAASPASLELPALPTAAPTARPAAAQPTRGWGRRMSAIAGVVVLGVAATGTHAIAADLPWGHHHRHVLQSSASPVPGAVLPGAIRPDRSGF